MIKNWKNILLAAILVLAVDACAKLPDDNTSISYDRMLKSWIKVNHPEAVYNKDAGVYVLNEVQGSGRSVTDSSYIFVHFTSTDLDGNILNTNDEYLDKMIGGYDRTNYYGSLIWRLGQGYIYDGLEEYVKKMKVGSYSRLAIPVEAAVISNAVYAAMAASGKDNLLFEFTMDDAVDDIHAYELSKLKEYDDANYKIGSMLMDGQYFKILESASETDTIADKAKIKVRYVGRRLDGTVFDTNIEDSAKFHRIYDSSDDYDALSVTFSKDSATFAEDNTVVDGFGNAIMQMKYGEKSVTYFSSDLGYAEKGSGSAIPSYCPLSFWIYIEPKDK